MNKKDYEKLADALFTARPRTYGKDVEPTLATNLVNGQWFETVEAVAEALRNDNDAFIENKFLYRAGAMATSKGYRGIDWDL
jgi:hypothetical protein